MNEAIDQLIQQALREDMPDGDATSSALFNNEISHAKAIAKDDGIISGLDVFKRVFELVDPTVNVTIHASDGDKVNKKTILATLEGKTQSLLKAERTALNFLQRMSGISTETRRYVDALSGTRCKILDTRKTVPTLRLLDKLAVKHGGGVNHRFSLSDMAMLKDNHIHAAGSITEAVKRVRNHVGDTLKIEVEVESIEAFNEALKTSVDWIMLDNMDNETMRECVRLNQNQKILEASGNMILDRVKSVAQTGVDYISVGALTHSVKAFDISLRFSIGGEPHDTK